MCGSTTGGEMSECVVDSLDCVYDVRGSTTGGEMCESTTGGEMSKVATESTTCVDLPPEVKCVDQPQVVKCHSVLWILWTVCTGVAKNNIPWC